MLSFNKILLCVFLSLIMNKTSCEKTNEVTGMIRDYSWLDGCKLLIVLNDSTKLEPQVLPQGITLTADRKVALKYKPLTDRMSICQVGQVIEIISLRYL